MTDANQPIGDSFDPASLGQPYEDIPREMDERENDDEGGPDRIGSVLK